MRLASLYRTYVRQIRRLPLSYLRHFFRVKAAQDIHSIRRTHSLTSCRLKRISRDIRKLEAANRGVPKAFANILDLAYGRRGRLKWEIMEPLLSDSKTPTLARIIPTTEKSRPPVYAPELKALLTSSLSRKSKPLSLENLSSPPTLPRQADPFSQDARLLGPFSKRREVNIRWRYFTTEWKKVHAPLQIAVKHREGVDSGITNAELFHVGVRGLGLQAQGIHEDLEALVGPPEMPRNLTRKELGGAIKVNTEKPSRHPSRWLRRRYQELLGRIPILSLVRHPSDSSQGKYFVSLSQNALAPSLRTSSRRLIEVSTSDDREWVTLGVRQKSVAVPGRVQS